MVRDKRVGVAGPFTDVLPFVVTASVRGMPSSQEIATTIEEDNGHSPHGGVVRHEVLRPSRSTGMEVAGGLLVSEFAMTCPVVTALIGTAAKKDAAPVAY